MPFFLLKSTHHNNKIVSLKFLKLLSVKQIYFFLFWTKRTIFILQKDLVKHTKGRHQNHRIGIAQNQSVMISYILCSSYASFKCFEQKVQHPVLLAWILPIKLKKKTTTGQTIEKKTMLVFNTTNVIFSWDFRRVFSLRISTNLNFPNCHKVLIHKVLLYLCIGRL